MDRQPGIELRVLGTPELRASDGSDLGVLLSQPKRLALFTYLLLSKPRGFHRRHTLLAMFWPESNEERARAALRQTLHAIRHRLGADAIVNRGEEEVAANRSLVWCDAVEADEALDEGQPSRAVALYRGNLLPGFFVEGAPAFQDWLDAERGQLRQRIAEGALGAAEASPPGSATVAAMIRRALDLAPADEAIARRAMRLSATTDPAAALRVYEELVATLQKEYEVAPSEATQSLARTLREEHWADAALMQARTPDSVVNGNGRQAREIVSASPSNLAKNFPAAVDGPQRRWVIPRRWRAAAVGVGILATGGGVIWASTSTSDPVVDETLVAVLPFRVTAADSASNYLREGIVDILNAQLTGDGVPKSVDARHVLNTWRLRSAAPNREVTIGEAVSVAGSLGAGRVIIGEFVVGPTAVTLSARMIRTSNGEVLASHGESVAGDPLRLASRILSALLAGSLGEGNERLSQLSDSLSAMKAYLAGMGAYRKGQLSVAHDHFRTALEIDTTFAAAAFWWSMSTIDPLGPVKLAADKALWSRRDRLSRRDRTIVATIWSHGPRYPEASTVTDFFAAYETAARANPDRPEPWLAWGNALAAYGTQIGIEDYETRAATILDSALALDSTLVPVLDARLKHAVRMRDTATVRRLAVRRSAMVGVDSESTILNEWLIALSLGDSAGRVVTTQRMRQATLPPLLFALSPAVLLGVPLADLEAVAKNRPGPVNRFDIASIRGRVRDALALADSLPVSGNLVTRSITTMVTLALVEPGYDDAARRSLRHPEAFADTAFGGLYRSYCKCFDELWRAREGKARNARAAADQIRRDMRGVEGRALSASVGPLEVCPLLIEFEASRGGSGEARALERLDSLVRLGAGRDLTAVLANLVIADWREKRGDYKGARAALRRRIAADHRMYYLTAPAYLRAEGRVSALLADTAGAIAAYNAYLALRDQPDAGPMQAQVAQVRDHLVQLLSARVGWSAR